MDVSDFVNCNPVVAGISQFPTTSSQPDSNQQVEAYSDLRSVLQLLVTDPDFSQYEFLSPSEDLYYPFNLTVRCDDYVLNSLQITEPERLMEIPDFLSTADQPPMLISASEEVPGALVQFAGDRQLQMLLARPDTQQSDLEIISNNFRSRVLLIHSTASSSSLSSKFTLVDFVNNFRRHTNAEGPELLRWLQTDHAKSIDLEIAGNISLVFIFVLSFIRLLPALRWTTKFVHRLLVPVTSLALIFFNFGREATGGCACCVPGACPAGGFCR